MLQIRQQIYVALIIAFIVALPVRAATFTVDSLADTVDAIAGDGLCDDGSGVCTLRAAIEEANALGGADITEFSVSGTIILGTALPSITQALTINGPGAEQLTISGNHSVRPFYIGGNTNVTLAGITIRDGVAGDGGGIYCPDSTSLTISHSTLHGNSATSEGGGIYCAAGEITITNSTISGNTVSSGSGVNGGGIVGWSSIVTITNSTLSGNAATSTSSASATGGGIFVYTGTVTITNSTITGNSATSTSGSAGEGGGLVLLSSGSVNLANSIVSGNFSDQSRNCLILDTLNSHHNIEDADTCGLTGTGDMINTNPVLGILAGNGGPTFTHRLLSNSPAIDAGDNSVCPATDQRGITRPEDGNQDSVADCDIGAVEYTLSPNIRVTPPTVDLGTVASDSLAEKSVYIVNDGAAVLSIGTLGASDPLEAPFSLSADGCSGADLQPNEYCEITVRLDPATAAVAMLLGGLSFSGLFVIGMLSTSRRYKKQYIALYLITAILGTILTACGGGGDGGGPTITDYSDSFDIPSNDPDTASVIVNIKGSIEK